MSQRPRYPRLVYLEHQIPGRLRLRLLRDEPGMTERLATRLTALDGVADVDLHPYTGSVLVRYDPQLIDDAQIIASVLAETGVPRLTRRGEETAEDLLEVRRQSADEGSQLARTLAAAAKAIDHDLLARSGGQISLGTLASLGLLGTAAARVLSTPEFELPEWYQLAWWAFRTFATVEADIIESTPAAETEAPQ